MGHSIGGWVARAWLAEGCSPADRDNVLSLTTLGTPNTGPPEDAVGPWTIVDQTRGLLKNINARFPGAHVEGVRYTSVAGTALEGELAGCSRACVSLRRGGRREPQPLQTSRIRGQIAWPCLRFLILLQLRYTAFFGIDCVASEYVA